MRKPNKEKIEEALKCVREEGVSINNLRKLGFTRPQILAVEKIVARECQDEIHRSEKY